MKLWLKIVFPLACAALICAAQDGGAPAPGAAVAEKTEKADTAKAPESVAKPAAEAGAPAAVSGAPAAVPEAPAAAGAPGPQRYIIGPLDVLFIRVWNNAQLSGPVDVRPDGMISMQLIGEIKADGLTTAQLTDKLRTRLGEFLTAPEVDVQVAKVNSKRYFVYGGVLRPGEFPLIERTTVMDALSMVGGFKDFANTKKIRIVRGTQTFTFNYNDVSKAKHMEQNIELQNGDRIFVPE